MVDSGNRWKRIPVSCGLNHLTHLLFFIPKTFREVTKFTRYRPTIHAENHTLKSSQLIVIVELIEAKYKPSDHFEFESLNILILAGKNPPALLLIAIGRKTPRQMYFSSKGKDDKKKVQVFHSFSIIKAEEKTLCRTYLTGNNVFWCSFVPF